MKTEKLRLMLEAEHREISLAYYTRPSSVQFLDIISGDWRPKAYGPLLPCTKYRIIPLPGATLDDETQAYAYDEAFPSTMKKLICRQFRSANTGICYRVCVDVDTLTEWDGFGSTPEKAWCDFMRKPWLAPV